jgi:hypothetical protein
MNEQEAMEIIARSGNWEQNTAGGEPITRILLLHSQQISKKQQ